MNSSKSTAEEGRVRKPSIQRERSTIDERLPAAHDPDSFSGRAISQLPSGPGTRALRQAAVLQMQRTHGNSVVMRQIASDVQRQDQSEQAAEGSAPTGQTTAPATEGEGPSQISSAGSSVSTSAGGVDLTGPMVNLNAAVVNADGVVHASTIIADSVVASSYTPGAGNIW